MSESKEKRIERLAKYRERVDASSRWRDGFSEDWELYEKLFNHKHPGFVRSTTGSSSPDDYVQVNYVHSTVSLIEASALHRYPNITAMPNKAGGFVKAKIAEGVLNYYWKKKKWQLPVQDGFHDSLVIGHSWLKTTHQFDQEEYELSDAEFEERFEQAKDAADKIATTTAQVAPTDEEIRESLDRKGHRAKRDEAVVEHIDWRRMYVDPNARRMDDLTWICQEVKVRADLFVNDTRWEKSVRDKVADSRTLRPNATTKHYTTVERAKGLDAAPDEAYVDMFVTYYEFYDIVEGTVSFFADNYGDDFMVKPKPMPYSFGHPFIMMRGKEASSRFYPIGEVEVISDLQIELNLTRSAILNDRKRFRRQQYYKPGSLTAGAVEAIKKGEDDLWIPVDDDVDFDDISAPIKQTEVDFSLYDTTGMIQNDINVISGTQDYQRGGGGGDRTATQVAVENDFAQARAGVKEHQVQESMAQVARNVHQLMQQFMSTEDVLRITGFSGQLHPDHKRAKQVGATVFYTFDREMISGEFDIDIEAGSTRPMNDSVRRQEAMQLVTSLAPFLETGMVVPKPMLVHMLQTGFGIDNPEAWLSEEARAGGVINPMAQGPASLGAPSTPGTIPDGTPPLGAGALPGQNRQGETMETATAQQQLEGQLGGLL